MFAELYFSLFIVFSVSLVPQLAHYITHSILNVVENPNHRYVYA